MQSSPFSHSGLKLPTRTAKPRKNGITAINDTGVPIGELKSILEDYASILDIAKLGIGSAAVTPRLVEKIELYQKHAVTVYFGGTLFEKFYQQGILEDYIQVLRNLGITWVEVSNGTIELSLDDRLRMVERLAAEFTVVGEVGCKDAEKIMAPSVWIKELTSLLQAGCSYVITEGRDSGTAGVYRANGEIRTGLIADVISAVATDQIIFEAPKPQAQMFFINTLGPNVNLGNVQPRELLLLESERQSLRSETLFMPMP
jgi:phosphosulfolactate synthase